MAHESTLPIWAWVMMSSVVIAVVSGLFMPFVSREDKKKAEAFRASANKEKVPEITIIPRPYFVSFSASLLIGSAILTLGLFFVESFTAVAEGIGMGITGQILVIVIAIVIIALFICFLIGLVAYIASVTATDVEKRYKMNYGVNVTIKED